MRRWIRIILISLLLAGGAVLCAIRWQAWFGMPAEPQWTGDTINSVFPEISNDKDSCLTVLVLGDVHNRLTRANYDTLAARVPDADFVIQTGDWMDRGQFYYRQLLLREWTASALNGLPVIACPGNHEYTKGLHRRLTPAWSETFPHPENGPVGVPGASYRLDVANMRIIVMDTNPLTRLVYLTRTLTWLREAMYSADGRFIVVVMHHPVISVARGRFNTHIYAAFRHALGQADLVLAGHDHSYMRRAPFVVLNAAGAPKPQQQSLHAEVTDTVPAYGIIQITNHPSQMDFRVYRLDNGEILDSLHVIHD